MRFGGKFTKEKDKLTSIATMSDTAPQAVPFTPKTEGERLALDIARTFNDEASLPKYLRLCADHDLEIVRRVFNEVQRIPRRRSKSRKAPCSRT